MSIYTPSGFVLPYVYKLIHKITKEFYYGYRYANCKVKINKLAHLDLGIKYKSSSKPVKERGFKNFDYEVIAEFETPTEAWEFEQRLIENNIKDPLCLNESFYKDGSLHFRFEGPHSEKSKALMSIRQKGRTVSEACRALLSIAAANQEPPDLLARMKMVVSRTGRKFSKEEMSTWKKRSPPKKRTPEQCANMNQDKKDVPLSKEHRAALSAVGKGKRIGWFWWNNGTINKFSKECPDGNNWLRGQVKIERPPSPQKGKTYWNNGIIACLFDYTPGEPWTKGQLLQNPRKKGVYDPTGKTPWNNGIVTRFSETCPAGENWKAGKVYRLPVKRTWWSNGQKESLFDKEPSDPIWVKGRLSKL